MKTEHLLPYPVRRICCGLSVALMLAGCGGDVGDGITPPPGSDFGSAVIVQGVVVDTQGREIFGATVQIDVEEYDNDTGCSGEVIGEFQSTVNESGSYGLQLEFDRDEFDACLIVEAVPPANSGFIPQTRFQPDVPVNEPEDGIQRLHLNFQLTQE